MKPEQKTESRITIKLIMAGTKRNCKKVRREIMDNIAETFREPILFDGKGNVDIEWSIITEDSK